MKIKSLTVCYWSLIIGLFIAGTTFFSSCKKEYIPPPTPPTLTYNLRFTNNSNNPYLVEVDGTRVVMSGKTYKDYNLKKGTYAWKVTQQAGYLLYPTVNSGILTLDQNAQVVFP